MKYNKEKFVTDENSSVRTGRSQFGASKPRAKKWQDDVKHPGGAGPKDEGNVDTLISMKAMKDLPHSAYSITADPYTAAQTPSAPYPLLANFNKSVGGRYSGIKNIDGGNVQQYPNSRVSKFLSVFDAMRLQINLNYRYLPIKPLGPQAPVVYRGKFMVDEMRKTISEGMSILNSTTYTQLALNDYVIETDLPLGSAQTSQVSIGGVNHDVYTNNVDVMYGMSIYYQIFWQSIINTLGWHNSFRLKQGVAVRDAWEREVPILNSFFGLMNKKSFLSLLDSINLSVEGEYIDLDFAKQAASINLMPSRRSNSLSDPTLECQTAFNHPTYFRVWYHPTVNDYYLIFEDKETKQVPAGGGTAVRTANTMYRRVTQHMIDPNTGTHSKDTQIYSFWEVIEKLNDYLSLEATKAWSRRKSEGDNTLSETERFNNINWLFDAMVECLTAVKTSWNDYRQAIDTVAKTGIITWTKGFRPAVTKDTDATMFHNLIVDNIYSLLLCGANDLFFDDATKRIRTYSLWNMYTGIPEYDTWQGGIFLTLAAKNVGYIISSSSDALVGYLPIIFDPDTSNGLAAIAVNRRGIEAAVTCDTLTISADPYLRRLAPLASQDAETIRVPRVSKSVNNTVIKTQLYSDADLDNDLTCLVHMLSVAFGMCRVEDDSGNILTNLDPDLVSIYQIEVEDFTNQSVTYSRAHSPFRGTVSDQGYLGFSGT